MQVLVLELAKSKWVSQRGRTTDALRSFTETFKVIEILQIICSLDINMVKVPSVNFHVAGTSFNKGSIALL